MTLSTVLSCLGTFGFYKTLWNLHLESLLGHLKPKLRKNLLCLGFQITGSEVTGFLLTLSARGAWLGALLGGRAKEFDHTSQSFIYKIQKFRSKRHWKAKMSSGPGWTWVQDWDPAADSGGGLVP